VDGLIGLFTDDSGNHYFLFMNMYRGASAIADQRRLSFTLTFDNSVNQLYRINRVSGLQEVVPLTNHQLNPEPARRDGRPFFSYNGFTNLIPDTGNNISDKFTTDPLWNGWAAAGTPRVHWVPATHLAVDNIQGTRRGRDLLSEFSAFQHDGHRRLGGPIQNVFPDRRS